MSVTDLKLLIFQVRLSRGRGFLGLGQGHDLKLPIFQASNEEYLPCQQRLYCHGREIPADLDIATLGEVGILPQSPYSLSCLTSPSRLTSP